MNVIIFLGGFLVLLIHIANGKPTFDKITDILTSMIDEDHHPQSNAHGNYPRKPYPGHYDSHSQYPHAPSYPHGSYDISYHNHQPPVVQYHQPYPPHQPNLNGYYAGSVQYSGPTQPVVHYSGPQIQGPPVGTYSGISVGAHETGYPNNGHPHQHPQHGYWQNGY